MNTEPVAFPVWKAVLLGHIFVTIPVLAIILLVTLVGAGVFGVGYVPVSAVVGSILAWVWWSWSVPRWRAWCLARGADARRLQKVAAMTLLVWPKGWVFEKTELPPRR